ISAVLATGLTPTTDTALRYVVIALLSLAMGARSAAVRALGVRDVSTTTVVTSLLSGLAADSVLAGGPGGGGGRLAPVLCMLAGAAVGALLLEQIDIAVPLFLAAAVAGGSLALLAGSSDPRPSPGG